MGSGLLTTAVSATAGAPSVPSPLLRAQSGTCRRTCPSEKTGHSTSSSAQKSRIRQNKGPDYPFQPRHQAYPLEFTISPDGSMNMESAMTRCADCSFYNLNYYTWWVCPELTNFSPQVELELPLLFYFTQGLSPTRLGPVWWIILMNSFTHALGPFPQLILPSLQSSA